MYVHSIGDCSKVQGSWSLYARYLLVAAITPSHAQGCVLELCWNTVVILDDGFRPSVVNACSRCSLHQKALSLGPTTRQTLGHAALISRPRQRDVKSSAIAQLCTYSEYILSRKATRTRGSLALASGAWLRAAR